ncbi:hypothetical protein LI014_02675 [Clostridium perfringens]|uniref:hypothetical protein n=1 Tax=Clostridium perfringens TaxID=1502 RepID=UPI0022466AD7|nr:hypothetical protein [Clostridium perfringens]MCX0396290.1 hypothetical protein [Clostridium perfringens]
MNDLKQRLEKQSRDIRNKMQLLILIKREFERDAKFSLGAIKRIVRYYPELLYLFKENAGWISSNIDKELLVLEKTLKSINTQITNRAVKNNNDFKIGDKLRTKDNLKMLVVVIGETDRSYKLKYGYNGIGYIDKCELENFAEKEV